MDAETLTLALTKLEATVGATTSIQNSRFDAQDQVLVEIRNNGRVTNGRITKIETERIAEAAIREERETVAKAQQVARDRQRRRREWTTGVVIALISVAASLVVPLLLV